MVVNVTNGGFLLRILWLRDMVPVWLRCENILSLLVFIFNIILHILNHSAALEWTKWTGMYGNLIKRRATFSLFPTNRKQIKNRSCLTVTAYDVAITGTLETFERQTYRETIVCYLEEGWWNHDWMEAVRKASRLQFTLRHTFKVEDISNLNVASYFQIR